MKQFFNRYIFLLAFLYAPNMLYSQFFTAGQEPFFTNWRHFKTAHYDIIYPQAIEDRAYHAAGLLESSLEEVRHTIPIESFKTIPVVMHNRMANANAFASWAPRRMEWYTIPPPTVYNEPWLFQLAVHEQRHLVQLHKLENKFLHFLFGEQSTGAYIGLTPLWFIEGDAVIRETTSGHAGRGRSPSFNRHYRALAHQNTRYSYDKAAFGSYKHYIPNHYQLGYQLTSYARVHSSSKVWSQTLEKLSKNPFRLRPFSKSLKNSSGLHVDQLYKHTFDSIAHFWEQSLNNRKSENYNIHIQADNDYTNYRYPTAIGDSDLVMVREGLSHRATLLRFKESEQEKLKELGSRYDEPISANQNYIVWSELTSNARWKNISYSVIKSFHLKTGRTTQLTKRSRLFSPAINTHNDSIVAVEYDESNAAHLSFFHTRTGEKFKTKPLPYEGELLKPHWLNDSLILSLHNGINGKEFITYDLSNDQWQRVSEPFPFDIVNFTTWNDHILFQGSHKNADQIYAFHLNSKKLYQVTYSKIAAENPTVHLNQLYFNEYHANGHTITSVKLDSTVWDQLDIYDNSDAKLWIQTLSDQEKDPDLNTQNEIDPTDYKSKKYSRLRHLFNVHSWYPFFVDTDFSSVEIPEVYPGLTFMSQNALSTFMTTVGVGYDGSKWIFTPSVTYRGFLPVIQFDYQNNYDRRFYELDHSSGLPDVNRQAERWSLRTFIPLSSSSGAWHYSFSPGYRFLYEDDVFFEESNYQAGQLKSHFFASASWEKRMAHRDLYPRLGQQFSFNYYPEPLSNDYFLPLFNVSAINYLPGLFKHHSLRITLGYEEQDYTVNRNGPFFLYSQNLVPIRGENSRNSVKTQTIKGDYTLPLFYPDWNLGMFMYIKRLGMNAFHDYSKQKLLVVENNRLQEKDFISRTWGVDLFADMHVLRFLFPVRMGGRFIYNERTHDYQTKFLFSLHVPY